MDIQNQSLVEMLRSSIEAWRTTQRMSREAVAIVIVEAHLVHAAGAATDISFDFGGSDAYDRAKKAAQKIFRWLDEGNLPANMIPSILAALPPEQRLAAMNQILCPLGLEARAAEQTPAFGFDPTAHLRNIAKEGAEGKLALIGLGADAPDDELLSACQELVEAGNAFHAAADDMRAEITARRVLARASSQST